MKSGEWKKASPELGKLLESAMASFDCQRKMMFGAPVYTVNGNMFAGIHGDNIFLRLSEADRRKADAINDEISPFGPVKGHIMKEYVVLPPSIYENANDFKEWLEQAYRFVLSLKPKEPKPRAKKGQ
ncbi:MAG: TfoX/Sxy family protein [Dehalococcoidia bacterium]|nr:TfoX/Sxy family protein [Dehalococcoidia bacterium]